MEQEASLLVDCLPPSSLTLQHSAAVRRALQALGRIFENIVAHPTEVKYRTLRRSSQLWEDQIQPNFYQARLLQWMGATVVNETHLRIDNVAACGEKLYEIALLVDACELPASGAVHGPVLLQQLRALSQSMPESTEWEAMCEAAAVAIVHSRDTNRTGIVWQRLTARLLPQQQLYALPLAHTSVPQFVEEMAVVNAERRHNCRPANGGTTDRCGARQHKARLEVAARQRRELLEDTRRSVTAETSDRYRALHPEERDAGLSLILDIAGLMQQVAMVRESQGMLRHDRLAARQLLAQFKSNGDVMALHSQKAAWEEELDTAKREMSKSLVFFSESK